MIEERHAGESALRRGIEDGAEALGALRARHAETAHTLTEREVAYAALGQAHEVEINRLRAEWDPLRVAQAEMAAALETVRRRLRA